MLDRRTETVVTLVLALVAGLVLFVWVPADTDTGIVETFRRQTFLGDAFLPSIAAAVMLVAAILQLLAIRLRRPVPDSPPPFDAVTLAFFVAFATVVAVSLILLYWAGPVLWSLLGDGERSYRQMRGTAGWKHLSMAIGGTVLVFATISLLEGRVRLDRLLLAFGFTAVLIALFDLPFDTILLPPNGDW